MGELVPETVRLPEEEVTVYPVISLPPVFTGVTKAMLACISPDVATILVGALGTVALAAAPIKLVHVVPL
jgi:hypothetical protein